ncbi:MULTISPECIES: tape measure protein [unclassified Enterococcus]|uniref:tape measure protein n=1 Tax=unclassified Enterococcus TaxID=2608891 RepID=UPI001902DA46|nr:MULTISPECIES: tape measure protein [unclassified Enterococcus]MBK0038326.1 tape measure protein [Enterococcus sp. S52]MBK0070958.1 tape measure protein [Enterococcus sp. S53]MBK0141483.1 tape measure protein [Enterococcus sp. S76]MBK0144942.1 tape measure protein [Enterococcus sp. S77]
MSRSDGKVTIDIIVNGKQVTKEIDTVEQGFSRLGKNADDVMKKVGTDMGVNTESGAKSANKAVDSVEKTVSELGKTTESSTAKAGKSLGDNFDSGAKGANQATDSVVKGIVSLTATTSTELAKSGRVMGESFESGAKSANQSNDSIVKSVASLVSSVESSTPGMGRSISESFLVGAKQATTSTDAITKSAAQMVSHVEISSTKAGKSIATSLESGSKDGAKTVSAAVDAMKKDLVSLADEAEKSGSKMSASFEQPTPKANILTDSVGKLSAAMLITKGATAALSMAKGSLDGAFGRIDTLNNFENTMTRLTGSSEEAAAGMEGVRDVVVGTNYMLDSAAQTVQRLVMQNGSLEQSTKSYQIWGDAVAMYGDGAAETMDNVMDAMIQMRATGTVNMAQMDRMVRRGVDPWKIYEDATGESMQSIRDALRDGSLEANDFFDKVEQAMRDGGNELTSVSGMAQQAGDTWAGSFANMATATSRGTANIIASMDDAFSETRFGSMKENVQGFGKTFEGALNGIAGVIPPVVSAVDTMAGGVIAVKDASADAAPYIIGLGTAFGGLLIIQKVAVGTTTYIQMLKYLTGATSAATMATKVDTVATKLATGANTANAASLKGAIAAQKTYTLATNAATVATKAFGVVKALVLNPALGLTVLALGAAGVAAAKMGIDFFAARKKAKELAGDLDDLGSGLESLEKNSESNATAFETQGKVIESNMERNKDLAAELQRLSEIENKSAADKKLMTDYVDELNNSVSGLNMSYDEETGLLSATTEEINKRIEASKGMEEVSRLVDRQNQLAQEAAEYETALKEATDARAKIAYDAAVEGVDGKKVYGEALEDLAGKEDAAHEQLEAIKAEQAKLYEEEMAMREEVAATNNEANAMMIDSYNHLSEAQKEALNSMNDMYKKLVEQSTNAFETMEQKESISLDKMAENLKKNAEAMEKWSTNVALLAKAGVDDGIIMQLEKMGPAGAEQAERLVKETGAGLDELPEEGRKQIEKLNEAMGTSMSEAMDSTARIAGEEAEVVVEKIGLIPEKTEASLRKGFEGQDFAQWGKYPVDEVTKGLEEGEEQVAEAAESIAQVPGQVIEETIAEKDYSQVTDPLVKEFGDGLLGGIQPVGDASKELAETPEKLFGEVIDQDVFVAHGETPGKGYVEGINRSKEAVQASAAELSGVPREVFEKEMDPETFKGFGVNIGEGAAGGIDQSAPQVENATKNMAELANKAFRKENDINSPSGVYREYGGNITTGLAQGIEQNSSAPERVITQLAKKLMSLLDKELNANQMGKQIGKPMVEGIAQGIDQNSSKVLSSIAKMTDEMVKKSKKAAEDVVKEFEKMDRDVDRTLQNMPRIATATMRESNQAYREGMRDANDTIREGAQRMPDQMSHLPDQFYRIGQNSMIGLNNGLVAGQAQVLNTAATIANQVSQTMQRALDINSPSKVMMMDVGRWIPAGIGEGIERFKHFALDAIEDLGSQLVLPNIQAESVAIAGNAGFGLSLPAVKSESTTTNQTIHNTPHIDIHFDEITINDNLDIAELSELLAAHTADEMRRSLE